MGALRGEIKTINQIKEYGNKSDKLSRK